MNELRIYRNNYSNNLKVTSKNKFFKEPVIVRIVDRTIEITHPTLDYAGKIHYPNEFKYFYSFGITSDIADGIYELDEESSNEDLLIFYKQ